MRRTLVMAAVAATALSVAACGESGNTSSSTTTAAAPTATTTTASAEEAAAWMDKVCGEIVELGESQPPPPSNSEGDPQQALDRFDAYAAENIDLVNRAINDLTQLADPPFRGGSQVLNALIRGLAGLRDSLQVTKDKFASIDPSNPQQARATVQDALQTLEQGEEEWKTAAESIQTNKDMEQAIKAAPNCRKLDEDASTTTTTT